MTKIVFLKLDKGNFNQGFGVTLDVAREGKFPHIIGVSGYLRQAPEIPEHYKDWQTKYCKLESSYRRTRLHFIKDNTADGEGSRSENSIQECYEASEKLKASFHNWLNCDEFRPIERELLTALDKSEEIRLVLQTEDEQLRKLPWESWNFFERFPKAELGISPLSSYGQKQVTAVKKVKILAILGNSDGIDTQEDKKILETLPYAEVCFLIEPNHAQFKKLWENQWDILFFAGHSSSKDGETGYIYINRTDDGKLEISELEETLKVAIDNGLQLAIFNSCDGLGLAHQLQRLHIPQVIVMREPVPDKFAQEFLKYFLTNFSGGMPLYTSVRCARRMLRELSQIDREFPGASWLPVVCQNPAVKDFVWPSPRLERSWWPFLAKQFREYGAVAIASMFVGGAIVSSTIRLFSTPQASCSVATEKREAGGCFKDLSKTPLVIGFLTSPYQTSDWEYDYQYLTLKSYLKKTLGNQVQDISRGGGGNISYQEAQHKIANKEWDIVFAYSPMNSWAAKSNGYTWVGRKEHYGTAYYHSVLFVRADSPIQSIADIKTATRVALGYIGSASSFYFPVYDLYGKSLSVTRDNPHEKIKDLVNKRQAHVGATMESFVSNEPGLRIIHRSRAIPVAGVFISPKLSESERIHIQKALIEAPPTIQEIANYRESPEINYDYIGQMSLKTEEVIGCANFNKNPVQLFCPK